MRSLGKLEFPHLRHLHLTGSFGHWAVDTLRVALTEMPNLHSLCVVSDCENSNLAALAGAITAGTIPKLSVLLLMEVYCQTNEGDDIPALPPFGYTGSQGKLACSCSVAMLWRVLETPTLFLSSQPARTW